MPIDAEMQPEHPISVAAIAGYMRVAAVADLHSCASRRKRGRGFCRTCNEMMFEGNRATCYP
jgi:hypothetical protein